MQILSSQPAINPDGTTSVTGAVTLSAGATVAAIDEVTNAIDLGKAWWATGNYAVLGASSTFTILLTTPATPHVHLRDITVNIAKSGNTDPTLVRLWGSATTSANGTGVTTFNANRDLDYASTVSVYTGPTITSTGTKLIEYVAHTDWETYVAPSYTSPFKIILKHSAKYLVQFYNTSNQPVNYTWFLFWMEKD